MITIYKGRIKYLMDKEKSNLIKIIYFDEQAAIDALEIVEGGSALEVLNKSLEKDTLMEAGGKAGKSFFDIIGFGLKGNAKREKNTIIQSQITSTLISHFLEKILEKDIPLLIVDKPTLRIQKESNAYFRNLLPMTHMVKDFSALESIDRDTQEALRAINFDQLGQSFDSFSAYYELEGIYDDKSAVFRFNIDGLRNNYSLLDLVKMSCLKLYGIKVGTRRSMNLTFDKEVEDLVAKIDDGDLDFDEFAEKREEKNKDIGEYPVIDVILAGIEA